MKKLSLMTAALVLVSFNVHAIPPPPPLPPAIGSLNAKLKVQLRISDLTKCDGYLCEQTVESCEMDVKIPVVPGSQYDEGSYGPYAQSADGDVFNCSKIVGSYEHLIGVQIYATKNAETGELKIITDLRSGKYTTRDDLKTDNSERNVTVVAASSPSLKIKSNLLAQIHNDGKKVKTAVTDTGLDVSAELNFGSLAIGAP